MGKNTSVSLGPNFEHFVEGSVVNGAQEGPRSDKCNLRLLEEEESRIALLSDAIREGLESGIAKNFDPEEHLKSLKTKRNNG